MTGGGTLTTQYSYPDVLTTTVTLPTGATTTSINYADGHLKSVARTAQATLDYDYESNSTGLLVTCRADTDLSHGGQQDQYDLLGRVVKHSVPAWQYHPTDHPNNFIDTESTYDPANGLLTKVRTKNRATSVCVLPDKLYKYNEAGQLIREGFNVNADSSDALTDASNDRITTYDSYFENSSGWRRVDKVGTFAGLNSATATPLSETHTRFTGFNGGSLWSDGSLVVGEQETLDASNRSVTRYDLVKPAAKKRWSCTGTTGVSNAATEISLNGYQAESLSLSGVKVGNTYDSQGRLSTQGSRSNGTTYAVTTSFAYYGDTSSVQTVTSGGIVSNYEYAWDSTAATRRVTMSNAIGAVHTLYNSMGLPWRVWGSAASPSETSYDTWGRRTALTTWQSGSFSGDTWPSSPTGGATTSWTPDPATGLLNTKTDAVTSHIDYTYTALGQVATGQSVRTVPSGANAGQRVTATYAYHDGSAAGETSSDVSYKTQELRSVSYNDGTPTVTYTYTRTGAPYQIGDGTGTRTCAYRADLQSDTEMLDTTFYDGRVLTALYEDGTGDTVNGRAKGFALELSTTVETGATQTYDSATGRLATVTHNPSSTAFAYVYKTGADLPASVTSGGYTESLQYKPTSNLLDHVQGQWADSSSNIAAVARYDYTYDTVGRRDTAVHTGAIFARYPENALATKYGYNSRSELTSAVTRYGTNADSTTKSLPGRTYGFGFDLVGNRTSSSVDGQEATYATNNLNQILRRSIPGTISVTGMAPANATVTVDGTNAGVSRPASGDFFSKSQTVSNASAPVWQSLTIASSIGGSETRGAFVAQSRSSGTECAYDADGNLLTDDQWAYTWDAENRLIQIETRAAVVPEANKRRLSFKYDYMGRRVEKKVEVRQSGAWTADPAVGGSTTRSVYNDWTLLAEYTLTSTSTLNLLRSYTWGLDLFGPAGGLLAVKHASGTMHVAAYDGSGNLTALVNRASGAVEAAYEYGPFGEPLRATGPYAANCPIRFSTQYSDIETGLVYYGHRYYSPSLGRFINRDPIEEQGGLNLYGFVLNNPINHWDVLGQFVWYNGICTDEMGGDRPTFDFDTRGEFSGGSGGLDFGSSSGAGYSASGPFNLSMSLNPTDGSTYSAGNNLTSSNNTTSYTIVSAPVSLSSAPNNPLTAANSNTGPIAVLTPNSLLNQGQAILPGLPYAVPGGTVIVNEKPFTNASAQMPNNGPIVSVSGMNLTISYYNSSGQNYNWMQSVTTDNRPNPQGSVPYPDGFGVLGTYYRDGSMLQNANPSGAAVFRDHPFDTGPGTFSATTQPVNLSTLATQDSPFSVSWGFTATNAGISPAPILVIVPPHS